MQVGTRRKTMSHATVEVSGTEIQDKTRAVLYLTETLKILKQLESERLRTERQRMPAPNIVTEKSHLARILRRSCPSLADLIISY